MGQQYNKSLKRRRRKAYLKRKRVAVKTNATKPKVPFVPPPAPSVSPPVAPPAPQPAAA